MFDIDAILKTKQEQAAQIEAIRRPILALYELIVEEGLLCRQDLLDIGLGIRFKKHGFDSTYRFSFEFQLFKTEILSFNLVDKNNLKSVRTKNFEIGIASKKISIAMHKKAYEVCFQSEGGSGKIILLGNAEAALNQVLKYLSTTMTPLIARYIHNQLIKE